MPTTIKLKNSVTTTNTPTSLVQGEVAINITDKKVWVGNAATTPIQLLGGGADGSFTNISVSGVASFADGTVSLPSITNIGDTNTGIFFPAADTIAFTEGGVESMRIDSSGNVGIGTSSPSAKLNVIGGNIRLDNNQGVEWAGGNNYIYGNETTDFIVIATNGNEAMRINSSGNVGIGTSSPDSKLHVKSTVDDTTNGLTLEYDVGTAYKSRMFLRGNDLYISSDTGNTGGATLFLNGGTERMRITSGGEVYIAGTTDQGAYNLQCNGTGVWGAGAYVNGSDERIKDDITPLDSGLDVVAKLNPVTYKYKEDWSKDQSIQTGFIAQELLTALEGKNYVDGVVQQGGQYMSVAYQNIIPILTKAIQEQQAMIEELKQEVAKLKGN